MAAFVLVHGAWQSSATWDLVAPKLTDAGHRVYTPALSGLGADAGRLTSQVNLTTHIKDVVEFLQREQLQDVTLIGHSYAGMVISGVAEQVENRLARLVYVDAFIPSDGQSAMDLLPEAIQKAFRDQANAEGDGWRLQGSERQLDLWGLKDGPARDFVKARLCDFSLNCFAEPLKLETKAAAKLPRTFIACTAEGYPARAVFQQFADRAQREGWDYHELPTGHDCHVEKPDEFVQLLTQ